LRPQRACNQPHGTAARYLAGCSCLACCDAWAEWQREWKADPEPRLVDSAPVRDYIRLLIWNGWRTRGVAEQAGVAYNTVRYCRTQRRPTMTRDSAAAILSLPLQTPLPSDSTALVPARSTLRLIERLRKHYTLTAIADACGVSRRSLPQVGQHSVQARVARRVVEAAKSLRAAR
jgi:hypothetical protein